MIYKNFDDITIDDFYKLIENGVTEGKTIEYKQDIALDQDNDKKEFLFDISSFANSSGGDLIFGISENRDTGLPHNIEGIKIPNTDELIRKMESLIRDGIAPRISGIQIKAHQLLNSNFIILIRIAKSWNSPHQVIFKGADKFYSRATNGKYKYDISELRSAFTLSGTITDRIRSFVETRVTKILLNEIPVKFPDNAVGKIALHIIPFSAFEPGKNYDMSYFKTDMRRLPPLGGGSYDYNYNLEGIISYSSRHNLTSESYIQFYRNGIIETVNCSILSPYGGKLLIPNVPSLNFENEIINSFKVYSKIIEALKFDLPIFVFLSFVNVKGYAMESSKVQFRYKNITIDRDVLLLPEIILDSFGFNPEKQLKPLFDMVWNACGFEKSLGYDDSGNWSSR